MLIIKEEDIGLSKKMAYVLRHGAKKLKLPIDKNGWVRIDALLDHINTSWRRKVTMEDILLVVRINDKQRFSISGKKIRANQGHSMNINLELEASEPPRVLFHGTSIQNAKKIRKDGLQKMGRQHVHLSKDMKTAIKVGQRHGKPVVFAVQAGEMRKNGFQFYISENNVWLVKEVPPEYLTLLGKMNDQC